MFSTKKAHKPTIDDEIDHIVKALAAEDPKSNEYKTAAANLEVLYRAKSYKTSSISADVIITAVVNVVGILLVLRYEELHVISSKAFGMIIRPR